MLWLPPTLTVAGVTWQVVPNAVSPTSVGAAHPSIDVSGLHGDYALTSIGAVVNWHHLLAMGNLLWRLGPGRILAFFVIPAVAA